MVGIDKDKKKVEKEMSVLEGRDMMGLMYILVAKCGGRASIPFKAIKDLPEGLEIKFMYDETNDVWHIVLPDVIKRRKKGLMLVKRKKRIIV